MKTRTNTVGEVRVMVQMDLGSGAHPPPVLCPHCAHPQIPAGRDDVLPRRHCSACGMPTEGAQTAPAGAYEASRADDAPRPTAGRSAP